jgi:hypothetical protein
VALTTHTHLQPRLKEEYSDSSTFWAFMDCSRLNFRFTFTLHSKGQIFKILLPWSFMQPMREYAARDWRRCHQEELHVLLPSPEHYSSDHIKRDMGGARMGIKAVHTGLHGEMRPFGRPKGRWEDHT